MGKRDTVRYTMRTGNRIEKFGITDDPDRRAAENADAGVPGEMRIEGPRVTRESAQDWETRKIQEYEQRNGEAPPYNKT
ncbi:hypothetical protein ES705_50738 [subsurface metagenome]